ncbi:unnamed protein product [Tilletia controversa]|uniref:Coiled-coil domain-containing protein 16 n=3 Tax=Tilletia TaxID=13289 RepID=A0A8X7MZ31_9BASI|nr:hypothetical protein CF336_g2539 [Tilletia laevis]KAE8197675.1 hypothetical protein CF328_g3779 [Tilletia controversa]KAE8261101.1 hypothetical protein A4X03_0g3543 [Tilletia caries]KAE8207242.1 hypothetical protein CF335_g1282 [Tilletia laevis]KAE8254055.1 hypothetical protein A4X06_0g1097 [Tilletia controversa]
MASDARSLLRAATSQRRAGIQDRFASYHPTTQALRCAACAYLPIKHESLWSSHAASKSHRVNVVRVLSEEREKEAAEAASQTSGIAKGKRKQGDEGVEDVAGPSSPPASSLKTPASAGPNSKRARFDDSDGGPGSTSTGAPISSTSGGAAVDEDEWARFEREVLEGPADSSAAQDSESAPNDFDIHASATISAEPVLLNGTDGDDHAEGMEVDEQDAAGVAVATEEELRLEREREEREEIISRFEEEQRIQDEADERVNTLKNRIQALKAARLAKQQAGKESGSASKPDLATSSKKAKGKKGNGGPDGRG